MRDTGDRGNLELERWRSVLVIALAHPASAPRLGWWGAISGRTPGNQQLRRIARALHRWLRDELELSSELLAYHSRAKDPLLKEAAVRAGLGVLGANNLLITPEEGPRVRLRGLLLAHRFRSTQHTRASFSPCSRCSRPCHGACPQDAFASGTYDRARCRRQMTQEERSPVRVKRDSGGTREVVQYCRECELHCPIGMEWARNATGAPIYLLPKKAK